jgi:hypothetical protein
MECSDLGAIKLSGVDYRNYLCDGTTPFFRRLVLLALHSDFISYEKGILIIDFNTVEPYISEEKHITIKQLAELLRKAKSEQTGTVRYMFSFGPLVQVLTPEPEVFKKVFGAKTSKRLSWIRLGNQAIKYVDSIVMAFGMEKAAQTLTYFFDCVTKRYMEEFEKRQGTLKKGR